MKLANIINIVQEYIVEPDGTIRKQQLKEIIMSNEEYKNILDGQNYVINTLADVSVPEVPEMLYPSIKSQLEEISHTHKLRKIPILRRLAFKPVLLGIATIGLITLAVLFRSNLQDLFYEKGLEIGYEYKGADLETVITEREEGITSYYYEGIGYEGIKLNGILGFEEKTIMARDVSDSLFLGYIGDIKEYYPVSDIEASERSLDILDTAEKRMGTGFIDEVSRLLEEASISTHKVKTTR